MRLIDELDLWPQTFACWQTWWREHVPGTRHWQSLRARLLPVSDTVRLPDALLGQLSADDLLCLGQRGAACCSGCYGISGTSKIESPDMIGQR